MIKPLVQDVSPSFTFGEIYGKIFGLGGQRHTGIDYPAPKGTPIRAPISGTVTVVKHQVTGYGNHLYITNANIQVLLAHMQATLVSPGQQVTEGQQAGTVGSTGWSTGPHVHIGVIDANDTGTEIDGWDNPELYYGKPTNPPEQNTSAEKTYTIKHGDTLWGIAEYYYGNGQQWGKIYEANKDTIKNPNLIYPGQTIRIP